MGGRGASSGLRLYRDRHGKFVEYGSEYKTLLQDGKIKFVKSRNQNDSIRVPEETRTQGRIYVTVGRNDELKSITRYDASGKKRLQVDLSHAHTSNGIRLQPHSHDGYNHAEGRPLTSSESRIVVRVLKKWREYNESK